MEIQGMIYTDKKQAGIALMAACTGLASTKKEEVIAVFHEFFIECYFFHKMVVDYFAEEIFIAF